MKKIFSLIIVVILLTACTQKYKTITTNEALQLIDDGALIIDVREPDEYNNGHIVGAMNVPLADIDGFDFDKETKIILYCASGVRSKQAVNILAKKGYTNLYNLDGGLLNWGSTLEE